MKKIKEKIILRSYPKAIFLYPLFFVTIIFLFLQWTNELWNNYLSNLFGVSPGLLGNWVSTIWLACLFFCLFVVSIEVKLSKQLAAGFVVAIIIYLLVSIAQVNIWAVIPNPMEQNLALPTPFYIYVFFMNVPWHITTFSAIFTLSLCYFVIVFLFNFYCRTLFF